jgi:aminopeptidase-like protein
VLTCLGGPRETISYKRSRAGDTVLDRTVGHLRETGELATRERSYAEILGSDERQYCSPGFDLPVGQVARTVYEQYEEYHTSADDRAFIDVEQILESATAVERILKSLEYAGYFRNLEPYGEPMLSKRDLYPTVNNYLGDESTADFLDGRFEVITVDEETFFIRLLRILHYSDGEHPMLDIAEMCGCSIDELAPFVDLLEDNELLCHSARDR